MITDNKLNASLELRNLIMVWNITLFYFILPPLSIIWAQALCFQEILVIENVYVSASTCISCVFFFLIFSFSLFSPIQTFTFENRFFSHTIHPDHNFRSLHTS